MRSDCHSFRAALRVAVVAALCVGAIEAPATEFVIDSSGAPELADWANGELKENAGKIIQLYAETFPSKGWSPPGKITISFKSGMKVPAYATGGKGGRRVVLNRGHFNKIKSLGCVAHELFHTCQSYRKKDAWIVEAMADYARFYVYQKSPGSCKVGDRLRGSLKAKSGYRTGANFIAFCEEKFPGLAAKLNAACREGVYSEETFWPSATGGLSIYDMEDWWKGRRRTAKPPELRIMTYDAGEDLKNTEPWKKRYSQFTSMVEFENPDVVAFQSLTPDRRKWLVSRLAAYEIAGEETSSVAIACRRARFKIEKIECGGKVALALVNDTSTGKVFTLAAVSLADTPGRDAAKLALPLLAKMKRFGPADAPRIVAGNFGTLEYEHPAADFAKYMADAMHISRSEPKGAWRTDNAGLFLEDEPAAAALAKQSPRMRKETPGHRRTDYIFVEKGVKVHDYRTIPRPIGGDTERYPSTHFPVQAKVVIE